MNREEQSACLSVASNSFEEDTLVMYTFTNGTTSKREREKGVCDKSFNQKSSSELSKKGGMFTDRS